MGCGHEVRRLVLRMRWLYELGGFWANGNRVRKRPGVLRGGEVRAETWLLPARGASLHRLQPFRRIRNARGRFCDGWRSAPTRGPSRVEPPDCRGQAWRNDLLPRGVFFASAANDPCLGSPPKLGRVLEMKLLREIYADSRGNAEPVVSFEFFPPKTVAGESAFFAKTLPSMVELKPDYCSVTYGAGGSTRSKTLEIVERIQREHGLTALAHLTCMGSTRAEIGAVAQEAKARGIRNLLALRGDPPVGATSWTPAEGGFSHAYELVELLQGIGGFSLAVAGFPEGHVDCREGREVDWDRLRAKIDCGADAVITQLFFDNRHYYAMRDYLVARGVTVPLVPGIIPILGSSQIKRFTAMCGAELPGAVLSRLDALGDDETAVAEFGIDYAVDQCRDLLRHGAPGLHFYTLNKARSTSRILMRLGLGPATVLTAGDRS
jgi:methylenetetrahydrofolate reductase (NADPH)